MPAGRFVTKCAAMFVASVTLLIMSLDGLADDNDISADLALAETFVDAFYSFDPAPMGELLSEAGEARQRILFYQGWALNGNYVVMERIPCERIDNGTVSCSITVQDDLVLALGIDFDVTDTFTISIEDGAISDVATSSNDPELYHDARDWVWENRRDLVGQACDGDSGATPDPKGCVRNALEGYREYARLNGLTPRAPK